MPQETEAKQTGNAPDFSALAQNGQRSLAVMAEMHSRVIRDTMRFNVELLDFTRRRLGASIETSDRLARCQSVTEAVSLMSGHCQSAAQDYADESATLLRMGTGITAKSA